MTSRTLALIALFPSLVLYGQPLLIASPSETQPQIQNDGLDGDFRGMDNAAAPGGAGLLDPNFGDGVGVGFPNPDDDERALSALFGATFNDRTGAVTDEDVDSQRGRIDDYYANPDEAEIETLGDYREQQIQTDEQARIDAQNRKDFEYQDLVADRKNAQTRYELHERLAEKDGVITDEEQETLDTLWVEWIDLEQFTPEEEDAQNAFMNLRHTIHDEIHQTALGLGGLSDEEITERRENYEMTEAGTKTWRSATFTGQMVNHVGEDIFNQRERGIRANNHYMATQIYLNQEGLSEDQIAIATDLQEMYHQEMFSAADAILKDTGVIMLGTAGDVGMLGLGRPIGWVGGKAGGWLRGLFGKGPKPVPPTPVPSTTPPPSSSGGSQAGGTLSAEARAAQQAANDAAAQQAVREGLDDVGNITDEVFDAVVGLETQAATAEGNALARAFSEASEQAANLSDEAIEALFKPGANLTEQQLLQKIALMESGNAPAIASNPETVNALRNALRAAFPEYEAQLMRQFFSGADSAAASGSAGAGANALTPPPGFNPNISGAGTVAETAGGAAAARTGPGGTQVLNTAPGGTEVINNAANAVGQSGGKVGAPTAQQIENAERALQSLETIAKEPL